jgi:hypothetical protein
MKDSQILQNKDPSAVSRNQKPLKERSRAEAQRTQREASMPIPFPRLFSALSASLRKKFAELRHLRGFSANQRKSLSMNNLQLIANFRNQGQSSLIKPNRA